MPRAARSAWVALRRPAVLVSTVVAAAAFSVLATVLTFTTATETGAPRSAPGFDAVTKASLAHADGVVAGLGSASTFLGIVAIVVGASAFAGDYQHGTLRTLLIRQPDRLRLVGGKLVAVWALLALAATVATVVAVGAALLVAGGAGVQTDAWTLGEAVAGGLRSAIAIAGYGLLGAVLGLTLRSPVAAIGGGTAWVLAVEQVVAGAWGGAEDVLPGRLLAAIAEGGAGVGQLLTAALWAVAAVVAGAVLVRRRDVTA